MNEHGASRALHGIARGFEKSYWYKIPEGLSFIGRPPKQNV